MTKVKPTNNKMNACHNTVTNGDFTLVQDSYNTYNLIITNTTLCNQMKGESNKEAYERNMLESIAKIDARPTDVLGIIKVIRYDKRQNKDYMYIGNVFWKNLYLTNHIVVPFNVKKKDKLVLDFEKGSPIRFTGNIYAYNSSTTPSYLKYGLKIEKVTNILKSSINVFGIENFDFENSNIKEELTKGPERNLLILINEIQRMTLVKTDYPQNFFINILLNLHFGEHYEKILIAHQNDYTWLCENVKSVHVPMLWLLYIMKSMGGYIDPYSVMCFITEMYKEYISTKSYKQFIDTSIDVSDIVNTVNLNHRQIKKLNDLETLIDGCNKFVEHMG